MTLMLHISLFERSFGENILSKKLFTSAQLQASCSPSETSASSAMRERICWKPADGDSARWWEALGDRGWEGMVEEEGGTSSSTSSLKGLRSSHEHN